MEAGLIHELPSHWWKLCVCNWNGRGIN